jgi:3-oxoacyl-[acyl-carrier-protein] synthase III
MVYAYINSIGKFLPGLAVSNDEMEAHLGKVNGRSSRMRTRILKSNGILQRHYALDQQQQLTYRTSEMAALAVREALKQADCDPQQVDLLAAATTWPDLLVPSFASMVHGEVPELRALETHSVQGVCCAGIGALQYAVNQIESAHRQTALAVAAEFPSRLFRSTIFEGQDAIKAGQSLPFDTEFLRWMLSDGAGAFLLQKQPNPAGISLRVEWIELVSHAHAYPVCMYAGASDNTAKYSWMHYPSYEKAAQAGALNLRQDIRLLDEVIGLGVAGWLKLIEAGRVQPQQIDWLLCHYSSHFFRGQIVELLEKANCMIPEEKWFTNLYTRGNTGCASIYLMLEELFHSGKLQPGQQIFCFVPESGRFTMAYMLLTVVEGKTPTFVPAIPESPLAFIQPQTSIQAELLQQLTLTWLDFEQKIRMVPIVRKLYRGDFTLHDYQALLKNLRPQVLEGARWIARAASNMTDFRLRSTFIGHAQEEHRDYQMLERNYVSVGGALEEIQNAPKNIGSEALSAFIFQQASRENPVDLAGSIFIIEGLGMRLAGQWAQQIQTLLGLTQEQVSFLAYHGANDANHLDKLCQLVNADWMTETAAQRIVKTAQVTARLYLLQLEEIQ